jgi:hypothetical protein
MLHDLAGTKDDRCCKHQSADDRSAVYPMRRTEQIGHMLSNDEGQE